jgi:hypothetical protein
MGDLFGPVRFQWGRKCGGIGPEAHHGEGAVLVLLRLYLVSVP